LHAGILGCVADSDRRQRSRDEPWLARRGQRAGRRGSERGARDVARERAQTLAPEVALVAGDLCSLLRRHVCFGGRPSPTSQHSCDQVREGQPP
jgi:hypothetical protein